MWPPIEYDPSYGTPAEFLLDEARRFEEAAKTAKDRGTILITDDTPEKMEKGVVSIKFGQLPQVIQFRAIVEEWSFDQCVRELHH